MLRTKYESIRLDLPVGQQQPKADPLRNEVANVPPKERNITPFMLRQSGQVGRPRKCAAACARTNGVTVRERQ